MKKLLLCTFIFAAALYSWSGKESAENKNLNFYGVVETHEGQVWNIQNIKIGRDRETAHVKRIIMYDKPKEYAPAVDRIITLSNDPVSMTYSEIDLNEVDSIEIPAPEISWIYKKNNAKYGTEYKEVIVTHKDNKKGNYLVELGRQDVPHKIKLFCTVKHLYKKNDAESDSTPVQKNVSPDEGSKNNNFCSGVRLDELEEKGIPLQAIKKLTFEGFCHQILVK